MENIFMVRKKARLPYEHGILANIRAQKDFFKDLQAEGYDYLLTCRINQDCVQNFFSCLRGLSGGAIDAHPDRLQVFQRIHNRLLCVEADFVVPVQKPNVEPEALDPYVESLVSQEEPLPSGVCTRGVARGRGGERSSFCRGGKNVG